MSQLCPKCGRENNDGNKFCVHCQEKLRGLLGTGVILSNGRYRVESLLGSGGMGAVYLARDSRLGDKRVAIKENLDTSWEAQGQFRLEATLLAGLRHPNLPQVTDHFIDPRSQRQYLVMEYIAGDDLEAWLTKKNHKPFNEKQVLEWAKTLMDALEYLHNQPQPIIHRDIKPANVKVSDSGTVKLIDLGISKIYRRGQATQMAVRAIGTPGYAPLEQSTGGTDTRSDIYALGATLYRLLTGRTPPEAEALASGTAVLPPPVSYKPGISRRINDTILKAMAQQPADRFQTIADMRRALRGEGTAGASESGALRLPAKGLSTGSPARSRRVPWVLLAAGVGLLVLLILLAVWVVPMVVDPDPTDDATPVPTVERQAETPWPGVSAPTSTSVLTRTATPTPRTTATRRTTPTPSPTPMPKATSTRAPTHTPTPNNNERG